MRLAGQASRSNKFAIFWAADNRNISILDLERVLRKLAFRVTWPSFANTTVVYVFECVRKRGIVCFLICHMCAALDSLLRSTRRRDANSDEEEKEDEDGGEAMPGDGLAAYYAADPGGSREPIFDESIGLTVEAMPPDVTLKSLWSVL
jgi:hypothetical protein